MTWSRSRPEESLSAGSGGLRLVLLPSFLLRTAEGIHIKPLLCELQGAGWLVLDIDATVQTGDVEGDVGRALGLTPSCPKVVVDALLLVDPKVCVQARICTVTQHWQALQLAGMFEAKVVDLGPLLTWRP